MGSLRSMSGFLDDRVDGECEKNRTLGVSLLNAPCAGNNLRSDTAGASEEGALVTVTTVDPRRDRRKMGANRLQDSGPVHRVQRVGDVQREGNLVRIGAVAVKPLSRDVGGSFATVRRLDAELKRFENTAPSLLVRRRMVSPTAIGRKDPLGLRRAMMPRIHTGGPARGPHPGEGG